MEKWSAYRKEPAGCVHATPVYDYRRGETVCSKCGLVLNDQNMESQTCSHAARSNRK